VVVEDVVVDFQFPNVRELHSVSLGINNEGDGAVVAPVEIRIAFGMDGSTFGAPLVFQQSNGTLPSIPLDPVATWRFHSRPPSRGSFASRS